MEKSFFAISRCKVAASWSVGVGGGWGGGGVVCRKGCRSKATEPIADIDSIPPYPESQLYVIKKCSKLYIHTGKDHKIKYFDGHIFLDQVTGVQPGCLGQRRNRPSGPELPRSARARGSRLGVFSSVWITAEYFSSLASLEVLSKTFVSVGEITSAYLITRLCSAFNSSVFVSRHMWCQQDSVSKTWSSGNNKSKSDLI